MQQSEQELQMFEHLRPELTSYCYRMLGSIMDADDAAQETYIRLWQHWNTFRQESSRKTWIYRIATNICLDKLRQAKRRSLPIDVTDPAFTIIEPRETLPDSCWVWPAPDFSITPEEMAVRRESLKLCFIALLQTLPVRQRAVLILKDVFEWSAKEIAETMGMTPAAVNSALQRARETLSQSKLRSGQFHQMTEEPDQELLSRYIEAFEQFDIDRLVSLFHEEGCMSMPPFVMWVRGKDHLSKFFTLTRWHCMGSRFLPVTVNGGYPAFAQYVPTSEDPSVLVPWGIHVVEMREGRIFHVQNFIQQPLFLRFGLPEKIHR